MVQFTVIRGLKCAYSAKYCNVLKAGSIPVIVEFSKLTAELNNLS